MTRIIFTLIFQILFMQVAEAQSESALKEARTLYSRLNGVPPSGARLKIIANAIDDGDLRKAAMVSIDKSFYNSTIKNMVAAWTNEAGSRRVAMNDYIATVIGMIRDDVPFDHILWDDITYVVNREGLAEYSLQNSDHYEQAAEAGVNFAEELVMSKQSVLTPLPADATAGILTSQGFSSSFLNGGTNRAAFKFTMKTFFCKEMEELTDSSLSDYRIRQDVDRSPGGDTKVYRNMCAGCHTGMDPMTQSMAYYDYTDENGLTYTPNKIPDKYFRGMDTFPQGYSTPNDSWVNQWVEGNNKSLGWNGRKTGSGMKSWGRMISAADQFPKCMAQKALYEVCRSKNSAVINQLANRFKANGSYNMKYLFAEAALSCRSTK